MREQGVEVLYLEKLVAEAFDADPTARQDFLEEVSAEADIKGGKAMVQVVRDTGIHRR